MLNAKVEPKDVKPAVDRNKIKKLTNKLTGKKMSTLVSNIITTTKKI